MKKILIVSALALASALFLTNCSKEEQKEEMFCGVSEKDLGELVVVGTSQTDLTTTGTSFVQALQAITGKQPTPYYKDTVRMKGDMRCVVRSYDGGSIQGVLPFYEGTEIQIKEGTATPVEEFSLQFGEKYKSVITSEMMQIVKDNTVDGIFEFTIAPNTTTKAGDMQEEAFKIFLGRINSIVKEQSDIPDTEIPINSTSGE